MPEENFFDRTAELIIDGKSHYLPILEGIEGDKSIDVSDLLVDTGYTVYDTGYKNSASCCSTITYLDGDRGILRYRGYNIEDLASRCLFIEVAYLLLHNKLPNRVELENFRTMLEEHALIHEDMVHFLDKFPPHASPMSILSVMVNSLHNFYPEMSADPLENIDLTASRLISKIRTIAAFSYKKSIGQPLVYPRNDLSYCGNFLNMMFDTPVRPYIVLPEIVAALNKLLILHADHEQNCSTSAVRLVGSSGGNLYSSISAGINALWGPLHGGANEAVIHMLEAIHKDNNNYKKYIAKAKDRRDPFRLSGFGHRVYRTFDPRGTIIKDACDGILTILNFEDPLMDIARNLEEIVLNDPYFVSRNLYPNIDFYSGIIYRALGIPTNMFTVMFALGRLPGWIAQWKEMREDPETKIYRPRQIYIGSPAREFVPLGQRT
ncbi:citrate synthase [Desulfobulbus oligotrophicus]|jgi:citrate synthase|uniref:Citrate synthase n=1 Tax=Desulfobulbus oligotrophicus TaxID=1909699 RepID=A0A7T5VD60_9BACT|nr:citrate synthase [Desulfobulbus oligotrophicus]MDY0391375.1 citrate synthase [Desulfobulbus oligotrophicus]QQG65621.1 citrate synthase [Desulfobulbus oligotrophicus]